MQQRANIGSIGVSLASAALGASPAAIRAWVARRPGQPTELASIYVQLAAADASYATGQVYGSSGGVEQP